MRRAVSRRTYAATDPIPFMGDRKERTHNEPKKQTTMVFKKPTSVNTVDLSVNLNIVQVPSK